MVCIDAQGQPSRRKRGRGVGSAKWKESWHEIQEGGRSCAACHQVNRSPGTEQSGLQPLCPSVVAGAWQQEGGGHKESVSVQPVLCGVSAWCPAACLCWCLSEQN